MVVRWTLIVSRIVVVAVDMLSRLRILTFVVLRYPEAFRVEIVGALLGTRWCDMIFPRHNTPWVGICFVDGSWPW